jgi:hypothetical protein
MVVGTAIELCKCSDYNVLPIYNQSLTNEVQPSEKNDSKQLYFINAQTIKWYKYIMRVKWYKYIMRGPFRKKIDASLLVSWNTVYLSVKSSSYRYDYCSQNSVLLNIVINSGNKRDGFRNIRFEGKKITIRITT